MEIYAMDWPGNEGDGRPMDADLAEPAARDAQHAEDTLLQTSTATPTEHDHVAFETKMEAYIVALRDMLPSLEEVMDEQVADLCAFAAGGQLLEITEGHEIHSIVPALASKLAKEMLDRVRTERTEVEFRPKLLQMG